MKTVGLTGGIGSGKSTVAQIFIQKRIPVYISDDRAKWLMMHTPELKKQINSLLGVESYLDNGELNRTYISKKIFQDKSLLQQINSLVHPAVAQDYEQWKTQNKQSLFLVKESAILFESGANGLCDFIISVVANEDIRIQRAMDRDGLTKHEITNRMKNQWTDQQRIEKSDFVIKNNGDLKHIKNQVADAYATIIKKLYYT